jgi:hypothetical protein
MTTTQKAKSDETVNKTIETINLVAIEAELRPKSTEELRFRFHECYTGGAKLIAEAAICVKLMQERGESFTGMPLIGMYRKVASGQIPPELVWEFLDSPNKQFVTTLPMDDQKRLVANAMVPVVEAKPEGGFTKRLVDLRTAPKEVAKLVCGPDGIRTIEEQMAHLGAQKARPTAAPTKAEEIQEPLSHQVTIKVTDSELQALKIRAALNGVEVPAIVRTFLAGTEAFKRPKT